jgi:hypothetical protein
MPSEVSGFAINDAETIAAVLLDKIVYYVLAAIEAGYGTHDYTPRGKATL